MAEAEQRMLNEEAAQEEQRRLFKEAAQAEQRRQNAEGAQEEQRRVFEDAQRERRRIQRMELIQEITDLERERDKCTNKLRRISRQALSRFNFGVLENLFIGTADLNSRLILRINDWADLLETDQDGNPQYPPGGCRSIFTALRQWIS